MNLDLEVYTSNEWHLLKGDVKYGPYTYAEVLHMMQDKIVFDFDYVWAPHLDSWTPAGELPDFSSDRISRILDKNKDSIVFNRRKHERVFCEIEAFVHDNQSLWEAKVENVSEGGALVLIKNPLLLPGNIINIHLKKVSGQDVSINLTAEILTKRLTKSRIQFNTGVHYAVKYIALGNGAEEQLKTWINHFKEINKKGA